MRLRKHHVCGLLPRAPEAGNDRRRALRALLCNTIPAGAMLIALMLLYSAATAQVIVTATSPASNASYVHPSATLGITFSGAIDPVTVTASNLYVYGSTAGYRAFSSAYDGTTRTLTLTPAAPFRNGERISVIITSGIKDAGGISVSPYTWDFTVRFDGGPAGFTLATTIGAGTDPEGVGTADFDMDGDPDLIVASAASNDATVYENTGGGTLVQRAVIGVGSAPAAFPLAVGDFDGDGDIDAIIPCRGSNRIYFIWNNGAWSFSTTNYYIGATPNGIAVGDMDRDGDLDLFVPTITNIRTLRNNGGGSFTAYGTISGAGAPYSACMLDTDGDGDLDVAVTRNGSNMISVFPGSGTMSYAFSTSIGVGTGPTSIAPSDVDGDGDVDLVVAHAGSAFISLLVNNGSGSFTRSDVATGTAPVSASPFDMDGDGDDDLVTGNGLLLENDGSGTFASVPGYSATGPAVAADFDLDGDADLAITNTSSDDLRLYLNSSANAPPVAVAGGDQTLECTGSAGTPVTLDGSGSTDPDGDPLIFTWSLAGTVIAGPSSSPTAVVSLPFGVHAVTLVVADPYGEQDDDEVLIVIDDTTPPTIMAPPDITESTDPGVCYRLLDNVTLSQPIVSDACSDAVTVNNDAPAVFPLGESTVTWTATDAHGNSSSAAQMVTIIDTEPPQITVSVTPSLLWPPNNKFTAVDATVLVTDNCSAQFSLVSVTNSEGELAGNAEGVSIGTPDTQFDLRASRNGNGGGREYTITYEAADASGNTSTAAATVTVPQSMGKASAAVIPDASYLEPNYPNPFNPSTTIRFANASAGHLSLEVFDMLGRRVATLVDGYRDRGAHEVTFDGASRPSGMYLVRYETDGQVFTRRITLLK